ncbi:MAG: hypothetical protein DRO95_06425 [Candidatus Altiarchaeales archaeon]|nr:MAG: hypothetical protein DRO95_06425 [Candidatus Altiarchaeales archaeon]
MTVVELSDGASTITIHVIDLVINYTKDPLAEFEIPVVYPWTGSEPETRFIDVLKVKSVISIRGYINANSMSGTLDVWDVYNKLIEFMTGGGCISLRVKDSPGPTTVRVDWGDPSDSSTYRAFPTKYQFTIRPTDKEIPEEIEVVLEFKHGLEQNQATS